MSSEYIPSAAELDREQALVNDQVWQAGRPELLELVQRYQSARSWAQLMDLQMKLVVSVRARQHLIGDLRRELAELRASRSVLARQDPKDIPAVRELQQRISLREHQEFVQGAFRHLLLNLGDAIAWRALGFDRAAVTILGQGPRVSWLSDGEGWAAELGALQHQWSQGHFSVLTDLTTCLRHGDLLTVEKNRYVVYEVKAGGPERVRPRELKRITDAADFITSGRATIDGVDSRVNRCPAPFRTYLSALQATLQVAKRVGEATSHPSPAQLIIAHDMRHFTTQSGRAQTSIDSYLRREAWAGDDVIFSNGSLLRRMRDRHHSFATLAPLAAFPLGPDDIADLLMGFLAFTTALNGSVFARRLEAGGIRATVWKPPDSGEGFLTVGRLFGSQLVTCDVAPHFREMMMLELMTPAACHNAITYMLDELGAGDALDARHMVVLADEHRVWK